MSLSFGLEAPLPAVPPPVEVQVARSIRSRPAMSKISPYFAVGSRWLPYPVLLARPRCGLPQCGPRCRAALDRELPPLITERNVPMLGPLRRTRRGEISLAPGVRLSRNVRLTRLPEREESIRLIGFMLPRAARKAADRGNTATRWMPSRWVSGVRPPPTPIFCGFFLHDRQGAGFRSHCHHGRGPDRAERQFAARVPPEPAGRPQRRRGLTRPATSARRWRGSATSTTSATSAARTSAAAPGPAASASTAPARPSPTPGWTGKTSTNRPWASTWA